MAEHPKLLRPVTEYWIGTEGVTIAEADVMFPGFQVYDIAPEALRVTDWPAQIMLPLDVLLTDGIGTVLKATVPVLTHVPL